MTSTPTWQKGAAAALIIVTLILALRTEYQSLLWAESLTNQGSTPPQIDVESATGYELGQRHFLATRNHGPTYRWIAYTQEVVANGPFDSQTYMSDAAPSGRPQQFPKLYAGWLAVIAGTISLFTDLPIGIAIEKAALWEPLLSHAIAFLLLTGFIARRFNLASAAAAGVFFVLFPFFSAQFVPGSLDSDRWALMLATAAIALGIPYQNREYKLPTSTAVLAAFALWLDPGYGFTAILIIAAGGAAATFKFQSGSYSFLKWATIGAGLSSVGWLIDQNPIALDAGELRYNHPLYAIAWLGLGLSLDGIKPLLASEKRTLRSLWKLACGIPLLATLFFYQIAQKYPGWLHANASALRPSDLDAPLVFKNALTWMAVSSPLEIVFILLLPITTITILAFGLRSSRIGLQSLSQATRYTFVISILTIAIAVFKIRWGVVISFLSIPILWQFTSRLSQEYRRYMTYAIGVLLFTLFAWNKKLPESLHIPRGEDPLSQGDLQALVQRHLSHWLASHNPTRQVHALATPAQSDSLIFHGNSTALLSTAWESYPGQIAASRILSAPENTEAQAILESREITHILLPSWDKTLPQMVQQSQGSEESTFYGRLQNWILPLYLRATPYHLPPVAGFESEKLAVFAICPQQDEALSMSRLTEYFVEMRRMEPAKLAAQTIEESYPQDPNASAALSIFYNQSKDTLASHKHSEILSKTVKSGYVPFDWDRRVVQSIALALNNKRQLARSELKACLETMDEDSIYQLTPLQTYQFLSLTKAFSMSIPPDLLKIALRRCSEYL